MSSLPASVPHCCGEPRRWSCHPLGCQVWVVPLARGHFLGEGCRCGSPSSWVMRAETRVGASGEASAVGRIVWPEWKRSSRNDSRRRTWPDGHSLCTGEVRASARGFNKVRSPWPHETDWLSRGGSKHRGDSEGTDRWSRGKSRRRCTRVPGSLDFQVVLCCAGSVLRSRQQSAPPAGSVQPQTLSPCTAAVLARETQDECECVYVNVSVCLCALGQVRVCVTVRV